jgi:hypothetical protein
MALACYAMRTSGRFRRNTDADSGIHPERERGDVHLGSAGTGATAYWLDIGTSPGGNTYYQSGNLGNVLSTTVSSLPADGKTYGYSFSRELSDLFLVDGVAEFRRSICVPFVCAHGYIRAVVPLPLDTSVVLSPVRAFASANGIDIQVMAYRPVA